MPRPRTVSEILRIRQYAGDRWDAAILDRHRRMWGKVYSEVTGALVYHCGFTDIDTYDDGLVDEWMGWDLLNRMHPLDGHNPCSEIVQS